MANTECKTSIDKLPDEVLNMIFKRINFQGHLRLTGVCKKWHNVVHDDVSFMRTVKFAAGKITKKRKLMGSYRFVVLHDFWKEKIDAENLQKLLKNAETVDFGSTKRHTLNHVIPLCKNLGKIQLDMEADITALTFVHPLPVTIVTPKFSSDVFDRFGRIMDISGLVLSDEPSEDFMAKYGAAVNSLAVKGPHNATFEHFGKIENFQLSSLRLYGQFEKDSVRSFFEKQAPCLKSIAIESFIQDFMFGSMQMMLQNLETVEFCTKISQNLRVNDLKALTKLKCLILRVEPLVGRTQPPYNLDITELTTLTELRITYEGVVRISSLGQPMGAIEKFVVSAEQFHLRALRQIALTMPGLKVLSVRVTHKQWWTQDNSVEAAVQLNKLEFLESITEEEHRNFLNNNCISNLSLPALHHLHLYIANWVPVITKSTLDKLAEHCPKLLRVLRQPRYSTRAKGPQIFARRMNRDTKFRKVHRIVQDVPLSKRLRFDYDSVESCSDEDCTEHS